MGMRKDAISQHNEFGPDALGLYEYEGTRRQTSLSALLPESFHF